MKTAIIITGAMRSFDECLPNLQWNVFRHFPGAKFYICCHNDEDAHKAELLKGATIRTVVQPEMIIPPGCPDKWTQGQSYMHEPYAISVHPSAVMGQLWTLRQGWELYQEAEEEADLIIRCRPDLWFHSFEIPHGIGRVRLRQTETPDVYATSTPAEDVAWTPWWGRFGGVNDRFALLGAHAASAYFTTYDHIADMIKEGAPLHPESLVCHAMKRAGISICDDMKAEFSTMRKSGEMRPPEITILDLAHFKS